MGKVILTVAIIMGMVLALLGIYSTIAIRKITKSKEDQFKEDCEQERYLKAYNENIKKS